MPDKNKQKSGKLLSKLIDDAELWHHVTRSVSPLHDELQMADILADETDLSQPFNKLRKISKPNRKDKHLPPPPAQSVIPAIDRNPLTGLDRRTTQRLARGQIVVDARIDLHGETVSTARPRLLQFLNQSRANGARLVLVITGKGASPYTRHTLHGVHHYDSPERGGIIRRHFSQWLNEMEFRVLVSGWQPAHPRHGGGGAFYVRLRRQKPAGK